MTRYIPIIPKRDDESDEAEVEDIDLFNYAMRSAQRGRIWGYLLFAWLSFAAAADALAGDGGWAIVVLAVAIWCWWDAVQSNKDIQLLHEMDRPSLHPPYAKD